MNAKIKSFFSNASEYIHSFFALLLILILVIVPIIYMVRIHKKAKVLYEHIMSIEISIPQNSFAMPDSSKIYVIQPSGEQEVIIIGDPEKVNVKPKKHK